MQNSAAQKPIAKANVKQSGQFLMNNIIAILILLFAVFVWIMRPNFISSNNIRNLFGNTAIRFIIALGVSGCLITRGTDLSAGRIAGFSASLAGIFMQQQTFSGRVIKNMPEFMVRFADSNQGLYILFVLIIVLAVCAFIGAINGTVVSRLKVPPFIATLGMQTLVYGLGLVLIGAQPIGSFRNDYLNVATGYIGKAALSAKAAAETGSGFYTVLNNISRMFGYPALIAIAVGIIMWFLFNKMRHGKYMYAIGGNESAAEVAGVNVSKSKTLIYMLAAMLYGLCGFLLASKAGGANVGSTGYGYELEAIAGCTIGGVSVNGGVGRISGILIGVLVFEVLKIGLQFMGVKSDWTYVVQGLVIITAVALDIRKYLRKK
ncbi:MAG: beta-methylgalactoside transporter [Oscillospiraceae bacterium]|jgi:methyl-galactoside transport system permease protein|nr:beta-methylgalactoside transporter [Oscillospiraceae bacterium]